MDVRQLADRDGGLLRAAMGHDGAEHQRDLRLRWQAQLRMEPMLRRIGRRVRDRAVEDERHIPPETPFEVGGIWLVDGHDGVRGLGPGPLPPLEQVSPRTGQEREPCALEVDVARVVDDPAASLPSKAQRDRERDQALRLPDVHGSVAERL